MRMRGSPFWKTVIPIKERERKKKPIQRNYNLKTLKICHISRLNFFCKNISLFVYKHYQNKQ